MANYVYPSYKGSSLGAQDAPIDLNTDDIRCMLVTSTYTPGAAHRYRSDVTNEVSGTGYATGGLALAGLAITASGANYYFTATGPSWAGASFTARAAVIYKNVGSATPADDPLVCYLDFGADKTASGGAFQVTFDGTNGILLQS